MYKLLMMVYMAALLQGASCMKKCKSYTVAPIRGPLEEYFGVYKPQNWWVYQNKRGDIKDSIYVTGYTSGNFKDLSICSEIQERRFTIKNNELMKGNDLYVIYNSNPVSIGINFSLIENQTQSGGFPQFRHDEDLKKLWSFPEQYNQGPNELDSLLLNNVTFYHVLKGNYGNSAYYFAKGKGLVGWIANDDIFNLVRYQIR